MIEVIITYNDKKQLEKLGNITKYNLTFRFIDSSTFKGKKESFRVKSGYSAKLDPFAVILDNNKAIRAFYTEAGDIFEPLIKYLNKMENITTVQVINKSNNKLPQYETKGSAGLDIRVDLSRVTPDNGIKVFGDAEVIWSGEGHSVPMIRIAPMSRALLPTGLFVAIPKGYQISLRPRSGLSIKQAVTLINAVGLIDSDYRSEIMVPVVNLGQEDVFIEDGERVCQALLEPVYKIEWQEVDSLEETDRKGGFGSTGLK